MAQSENISNEGKFMDLLNKAIDVHESGKSFVNFNGCILPGSFKEAAEAVENFQVRDDDVWVCTFPKSGTTWTQEMVWCIMNDLDFKRAKAPLNNRFPYFENSSVLPKVKYVEKNPEMKMNDLLLDSLGYLANMPSPRFIKSHLPTNLLPRQMRNGEKKPKVIYVVRNVKDACISYYHFYTLTFPSEATLEDFFTLFLNDTVLFGPYWKHVLGFWNKRNEYDMLFLKFEDMKQDLPSVINKTATFLGKTLTTDQVASLTEHLRFAKMKDNPAVNWENEIAEYHQLQHKTREGKFMRSGSSGQWKTRMTPEMIKRFDDWIAENLKGTGLEF